MKAEEVINPSNRFRYFLEGKLSQKEIDSLEKPNELHYFFKKYPIEIIKTSSFDLTENLNIYFEEIDEFEFPNPYAIKSMIVNYLIRDIDFTIKAIEIYKNKKSKILASRIKLRNYGIVDILKTTPQIANIYLNNLTDYKDCLIIELEHLKRSHLFGIENSEKKIIKVSIPKIIWRKTLKSLYTLLNELKRLQYIEVGKDIYELLSEHFAVVDTDGKNIKDLEPRHMKDYMAKLESKKYLHEKDDIIMKIVEKVIKEITEGKENAN